MEFLNAAGNLFSVIVTVREGEGSDRSFSFESKRH